MDTYTAVYNSRDRSGAVQVNVTALLFKILISQLDLLFAMHFFPPPPGIYIV